MKTVNFLILGLYALLWLGGIANYVFFSEPSPAASWAGPLFLLCAFLLAVLPAKRPLALWLLAAGAGGFIAELIGLHTGLVFGDYHYSASLGPQAFGVPLSIATAWGVLLVCACSHAVHPNRFIAAAAGAAWMVTADLLIDPLASGPLEYWQWPGGGPYFGVPLLNFLGWFVVSYLLLLALPRGVEVPRQSILASLSVVSFYGVIALSIPGMRLLSLIALGLVLLQWFRYRRG